MMEMITLERTIRISASRERVWAAVTHPDQLVKWFVPNLPGAEMKRDEQGKVSVHFFGMGVDFLMLETLDASHQVIVHSLPEHLLTTTFTFEAGQEDTLVTVAVTGFEKLVEKTGRDRQHFIGKGWAQALENLKAHLFERELPFPQTFVGSLFGYWKEPEKKLAIERSIWIQASRERVWRAVTDPKQIQAWCSPSTNWQLSALEIGGRYYVYDTEAGREKYVEIIEVLNPPSKLTTRCLPEAPDTILKIKTYTLTEEKGGTRMTLTLAGYEQEPDESRWGHMEENGFGFGMMLQNAKAYLEGESLPFPAGF